MTTQEEDEVDAAMASSVSRFARPGKNASAPATATATAAAPAPAAATSPAPAGSDQEPAMAEVESTPDTFGSEKSILQLIPHEAQSKRGFKLCTSAVDKWEPPKELSKREVDKYRQTAMVGRVSDLISTASRLQLGLLLIEAKERLKHGQFRKYVEQACGIDPRRSAEFMAVARTFTDHRLVLAFGYDFCVQVATKSPPQAILDRITGSPDRATAQMNFESWLEDVRVENAFLGLPVEKPMDVFGRELAVDMAVPNVVREFREHACEVKDQERVRDLLNAYRAKLLEGKDGHTALNEIRGQERAAASPNRKLRLKNLFARIEALSQYQDTDIGEQAEKLAQEVENKLLELEQMIQGHH